MQLLWNKENSFHPASICLMSSLTNNGINVHGPQAFSKSPRSSYWRKLGLPHRFSHFYLCFFTSLAPHAGFFYVYLTVHVCIVRPRSNVGGAGVSAEPMRMSVVEGEDAILPCEVHSVPPPTISWAKERQLISPFSPR